MECYIVDAFTEKLFEGNPAAVCVLDKAIDENLMQNIASENNLSETAFVIKNADEYSLRWFTPHAEIDLCGHATLASAFVLANFFEKEKNIFNFNTLSGRLKVIKKNDIYELNFPLIEVKKYKINENIKEAFGQNPIEAYIGRDPIFVFENEEQIKNLSPNFEIIKNFKDGLAAFVCSKSENYDFTTRAFWPKMGVNEDPVCGSMYCSLAPLWAQKLSKNKLIARQHSKRGGTVYLETSKDSIKISGKAVLYSISKIILPNS